MTFCLAWAAYCDMLSWKFFEELPREQQVAVRLRWGNRISEWYWNEIHVPLHTIPGADKDRLDKIIELLDMTLEGKDHDETTNGNA